MYMYLIAGHPKTWTVASSEEMLNITQHDKHTQVQWPHIKGAGILVVFL